MAAGRVNVWPSLASSGNVFGVEWDYANPSTALTRLTRVSDPNHIVTGKVYSEPNPAVGTGGGSSPFDSVLPWSGMDEFNVVGGTIAYRRGDAGFSRTANDTVVGIPKFWYKIEKDTANSKMRFYVSGKETNGLDIHPAFARGDGAGERDYIYVGKYNTGAGYVTKSGLAPLTNITRAAARTGSHNKGTKWWQYDYAAWCAIWLLYLVEFADWDSQARIGKGNTGQSSSVFVYASGQCDDMVYHTGRWSGENSKVSVVYRGLENLWGNVYDRVDGINIFGLDDVVYLCLVPALFADNTNVNYTPVPNSKLGPTGYIKTLGFSPTVPFAFLPSGVGSATTFIPDYYYQSSGDWRGILVGGSYNSGGDAGLFFFNANSSLTGTSDGHGARLMFLP